MKFLNEDLVPDINSIVGDLTDIDMVNFEIICMNQLLAEFRSSDTEGNIK